MRKEEKRNNFKKLQNQLCKQNKIPFPKTTWRASREFKYRDVLPQKHFDYSRKQLEPYEDIQERDDGVWND